MTLKPNTPAPAPDEGLVSYFTSLTDADYLRERGPLGVLRLIESLRTALRAYEESVVHAARANGATWDEIGRATGRPKQAAHRSWKHLG